LAICVLSEVGAQPGRFRAAAGELEAAFAGLEALAAGECDGELEAAFAGLEALAAGECDGQAWLLARAPVTGC
ncbi:hypothetical protein H7J34_21825, partial [Mycolicibacterium alvei]|nr:hypothetical protein [Mycolicibacterium alvei]